MKWAAKLALMWEKINLYRFLVGRPERSRPVEKSRRR
jgi:hypothetical protein